MSLLKTMEGMVFCFSGLLLARTRSPVLEDLAEFGKTRRHSKELPLAWTYRSEFASHTSVLHLSQVWNSLPLRWGNVLFLIPQTVRAWRPPNERVLNTPGRNRNPRARSGARKKGSEYSKNNVFQGETSRTRKSTKRRFQG